MVFIKAMLATQKETGKSDNCHHFTGLLHRET